MGKRLNSVRLAATVVALGCASTQVACGQILGIDPGIPFGDASIDAGGSGHVMTGGDGGEIIGPASDGSDPANDAVVAADAPPGIGSDAALPCVSQSGWCDMRCGTSQDNCGRTRECQACATGETCNPQTYQCECAVDPNWCVGRCQVVNDSCGTGTIDCGPCEAGACTAHVCGCLPESDQTACNGKQCGQVMNNCNLTVNCGANSTPSCANGAICQSDQTCCTPDNTSACSGKCAPASGTDNCGQSVPCGTCPAGEECTSAGTCCAFTSCASACTDNCGVANAMCCPEGGGGSCAAIGASCTSNAACCSGACADIAQAGTCNDACKSSGVACMTGTGSGIEPCCYPQTCQPTINPLSSPSSGLAASPLVLGVPGTCE